MTEKPPAKKPKTAAEECLICFDSFDSRDKNWKVLYCDHKVCADCFIKINITRTTMSGISHNSVKCPFCQITTGIIVGICPDGKMAVNILNSSCAGFEDVNTIEIHYFICGRYHLNRVAYLPNNSEGQEILELLKIAWDRRVAFTIGTSVTTGVPDTVVWNIHHKTSQSGGVEYFGYPDPTYFQRVKLELEANGVALNSSQ